MNQTMQDNPLRQYFRQIKTYLKLPSGTTYYSAEDVKFTDSGEIGIMPMTGTDELALKNPDSLLNGEALVQVIKSCVPGVNNPKVLLTNDIDALITAIRWATFNDNLETSLTCPECSKENVFKLDLQYALDNMGFLEPEHVINLESGISVFVKPYSFTSILKELHSNFEQNKLKRIIENDVVSDEKRVELFAKVFKEISVVTFELMSDSIVKIVDESRGVNVTNKAHINEFIHNTDKISMDKISDLIKHINLVGIKRTFTAKCEQCGHEWESEIDFNPVNFS